MLINIRYVFINQSFEWFKRTKSIDLIIFISNMSFFGVSWKSYLSVASDNRLCLFDSENSTEKGSFVEVNHLNHVYTCHDWLGGRIGERDYFACGASDGTIIVWDITRGVVAKTLGKVNGTVATSINFSLDRKTLYVATGENFISAYSVQTGEQLTPIKCGKKPVKRIRSNPKANVLAYATR